MMGRARLSAAEIDRYLTQVARLPLPGDGAEQLLSLIHI